MDKDLNNTTQYESDMEIAWQFFYDNKLDEASDILVRLINENPEKTGHNYLLGHVYREKGLRQKAVDHFLASLDGQEEKDGYAYYWLGIVYGQRTFLDDDGSYIYDEKKSEEFYSLVRKAKNFPPQLLLHFKNKLKGPEKISLLEQGIEKFPDLADFYVLLAQEYRRGGLHNLELLTYQRAVKKEIVSSTLYYNLGLYYCSNNDYTSAITYFVDALKANKNYSESNFGLHYWLGKAQRENGDYEEAEKSFLKSCKESQADPLFGFLSLLDLYLETADKKKIEDLVLNFEMNEEVLEDYTRVSGGPLDLSEFTTDSIHFDNFKILHQRLTAFKVSPKENDTFLGKLWLIKGLVAKHSDKYLDQYKAIKNARKYLNAYHFDFLDSFHSSALYNLVSNRLANYTQVQNTFKLFISDLSEFHGLRNKVLYSVAEMTNKLFELKEYKKLIQLSKFFTLKELAEVDILFKVAYSNVQEKNTIDGKKNYEEYLKYQGDNSAVLNNLALIYKQEGQIEKAIELYKKGLKLDPEDDHLNRNIKSALEEKSEIEEKAARYEALRSDYQHSLKLLKSENEYVLDKLKRFIHQVKMDEEFENWRTPIPKFKFQKLLATDKQRADSLVTQWLSKKYITDTDERNQHHVIIYEVNPLLEQELNKMESHKIPSKWLDGLVGISIDGLDSLGYFEIIESFSKVNKKFKPLLERDFNEVTINYLIGNYKSTIVLSGSLIELALTFFCERKRIMILAISDSKGGVKNKKLYDCVLSDLITFVEENHSFGNDFLHLTNLSRIYRNFIHPGRELKGTLDKSKADLCYISTVEILRRICKLK